MKKIIFLNITFVLIIAALAPAVTRLVPSQYPTIQAAIDACVDGDAVIVAPGTYTGPGNRKIILRNNTAITIKSANGPKNCVIDCEGKSPAFLVYNRKKGRPVIDGFTITGGNAGNYDRGGTIRAYMGGVDIINCVITNNKAKYGGAIGFETYSVGTVSNCYISGNSAYYNGGGISCFSSCKVKVSNCIITGNKSLRGAAVDCYYNSEVDVINSTIVGNVNYYAERYGALHCMSNSTLNVFNCIIWDNLPLQISTAHVSDSPYMIDNWVYLSNNDIQGENQGVYDPHDLVEWGPGNIGSDPCFAPPPYRNANGLWVDGDYHLLDSSPCIDTGINDPPVELPTWDLDGESRVLDGDGNVIAVVDIGADELNPESSILAVAPTELEFVHLDGEPNPAPQILSIWNAGGGSVSWEIAEDCDWLEVSETSGQSSGQVNEVTVSVDLDGLAIGGYSCTLSICAPNSVNSRVPVPVVLRIGEVLHVPEQFPTIQAAIDAAADGHKVVVAEGVYTGDGNRDIDFLGKAITVRSIDPNDRNIVAATIIDCNGTWEDEHRGFYFHSGEKADSIVEGFKLTKGNAEYGGAIYCKESSPAIVNCIIKDNSAEYGGGIYGNRSSNLIISNCTITGNSAKPYGGGIYFVYGSSTISNCTISWNKAEGRDLRASGGGIYHKRSCAVISNCTISGNTAEGFGGGGIYCRDGDNNTRITNCVISGNSTKRIGGGILCGRQKGDSTFAITNCTISGNTAGESGGGICCSSSTATVTNCTISGNSALQKGGGIFFLTHDSPTITNSILWANEAQYGPDIFSLGNVLVTYNTVPDGWHGVGNIDADPCFVKSGYWDPNSTPSDANDDFWVDGDYHLKSEGWRWDTQRKVWKWDDVTSRCIDAGNPGSPVGEELLSVPVDPNNEWGQNLRINMGAFGGTEQAGMPPYGWAILSDVTNDGTVDFIDLAHWAGNWLSSGGDQPGDLDRNGIVDIVDFTLFAQDWFAETAWHK